MKVGLIGLKGHHNVVLDGILSLPGFELVALSDDDPAALATFVRDQPLAKNARPYANWRHLLEHAPLDFCCVADENALRVEQLTALLERNVHIVAEKPLATNLDDLKRLQSALPRSKSRLTMLLTMRHEAKYVKMRELVQSGAIGQICLATAQKSYRLGERSDWFKSRKRLGGIIPYIGIHALDLIRWVGGQDFTQVAAFHGRIGKEQMGETENHASLALQLANGGSATARLDYLRPEPAPTHGDDRLRLAGTEGVLEARGDEPELLLVTGKKPPEKVNCPPTSNLFVDFVNAIQANRESRIPAADCLYATEVVLHARDAADQAQLRSLPKRTI